jgi:hypothetical protein
MIEIINEHLNKFDFDVRKSRDARFMDQKVTPDVLCIIADCVSNFVQIEILNLQKMIFGMMNISIQM